MRVVSPLGLSYDGDWLVSTRADDAWCARASLALAQAGIGVIRMEDPRAWQPPFYFLSL